MAEKDRLRNKGFFIHLTEEEHKMLSDKAEYCDITKSEFVRGIINNGAIIKYATCDIQAAIAEINRVGNNINQIAKKLNETGSFLEQDFEELKMAYEKLFEYYIEKMIGK